MTGERTCFCHQALTKLLNGLASQQASKGNAAGCRRREGQHAAVALAEGAEKCCVAFDDGQIAAQYVMSCAQANQGQHLRTIVDCDLRAGMFLFSTSGGCM